MAGYIKLHRQLMDSLQFKNPNYLKVWVWMLLKANHKPGIASIKVNSGFSNVPLNRGQFIFGREKAEEQLNLNGSMIYRILKIFEKDNSIIVKSNNKYSIITICKYDSYNGEDLEVEQPVNSQRTASEQPVNTNKNDKNVKNDKKELIVPSPQEVFDFFVSKGYKGEIGEKAFHYYNDADWKDSNNKKVIDWKRKMSSVWFKDEHKIKTKTLQRVS